jgi:predicted dehydrogenase
LIIGFGSIGKRHARNLRHLQPDIMLTVLRGSTAADPDETALEVTRVAGFDDALRTKPDFAVIASPSNRHAETLLPLLRSGVPCYIEKPVVANADDIGHLRDLLRSPTRMPVTFAGCNLRFLPSLGRLRTLIVAGKIGRPVRAALQVGQWLPDWRPRQDYRRSYSADPTQGGGVILDLIHEIDVARWLFGEFDQVKAVAGKFSALEISTEDSACIVLAKTEGGPLAAIQLDYVSRRRVRRYEVVGDAGTLTWDLAAQTLELTTADAVQRLATGEADYDVARTYVCAMEEFLQCVREGRPTSQDLAEGVRTTELALRARASAGL